ncbi:3437_t:CDS:2 [Ambispora gerdemannii]|uniref:3437_t:CDS:1 n=1 Tax=Ambispora gerdemannii TaxID=144530 RepID=A0A9N8UZ85_9GLOM|nr:3437_t:CDS:2 [Ambispora gerdemannii]
MPNRVRFNPIVQFIEPELFIKENEKKKLIGKLGFTLPPGNTSLDIHRNNGEAAENHEEVANRIVPVSQREDVDQPGGHPLRREGAFIALDLDDAQEATFIQEVNAVRQFQIPPEVFQEPQQAPRPERFSCFGEFIQEKATNDKKL